MAGILNQNLYRIGPSVTLYFSVSFTRALHECVRNSALRRNPGFNIEGSCRSWKKIVKSLDDGSVKGRFGLFGSVSVGFGPFGRFGR